MKSRMKRALDMLLMMIVLTGLLLLVVGVLTWKIGEDPAVYLAVGMLLTVGGFLAGRKIKYDKEPEIIPGAEGKNVLPVATGKLKRATDVLLIMLMIMGLFMTFIGLFLWKGAGQRGLYIFITGAVIVAVSMIIERLYVLKK